MNKLRYRVIFSKTRNMLMVVSELVKSHAVESAHTENPLCSFSSCRVALRPLILSISLALGLVSLPVGAAIVADNRAPDKEQPTVTTTANGIPQVNIQTPNQDGISRNQYRQFDVPQNGVILNNSSVNTKTDLADYISGNPWLEKGEAKIILNEVNSRDPSKLNGFIEVAGKRADVIVANPAGITCQSCGFINAGQTTLAAGQAVLENGRLKGFEVTDGNIAIGGKGFNDANSDHTRLIARAVNVNAKLHAQKLSVTTGQNRTDADGNVLQTSASDENEKPEFSLDVAAIGGMYANKIKMIGTEKGVGVRSAGQLGAQAGEIVINSEGKLINSGIITASTDVAITNQGEAVNQGTIQAQNVTLSSQGDFTNSGKVLSATDIRLDNQGNLVNSGDIDAGQDITVTTRDHFTNQGNVLSDRHTTVRSAALENQKKGVLAAGVDKHGKLGQPGNLAINSDGSLTNRGKLTASNDIQLDNQGDLTNSGAITAHRAITVTTRDSLTNQGQMLAGQHLTVKSAAFENQDNSELAAGVNADKDGNLTIDSNGAFTNRGALTASDTMTLENNGHWLNQGQVRANDLAVRSESDLTNSGTVTVARDIRLDNQGNLTNTGGITAEQNLTVTTRDRLTNAGKIRAGQHLTLHSAAVENQKTGVLNAGVDPNGNLARPGQLEMTSQKELTNRGMMVASDTMTLDNQGDWLNQGHVQAKDLAVKSQGHLTNQGSIAVSQDARFDHSGNLLNQGDIQTGRDLRLTVGNQIDNQGTLRAGRHLDSQSTGITSSSDSILSAGIGHDSQHSQPGNLTVNAGKTAQLHGQNSASDNLIVNAGDISLQGSQTFANNGQLKSDTELDLQDARLKADNNLSLTAPQLIDNRRGQLTAKNLTLTSQKLLNNQGKITQTGETELILNHQDGIDNTEGLITTNSQDLRLQASTVLNERGLLNHTGAGTLSIETKRLAGQNSRLLSAGTLDLKGGDYALAKSRTSARQITANLLSLDHRLGSMHQSGTAPLSLTIQNMLDNRSGTVEANGNVVIKADKLNNHTLTADQLNSAGNKTPLTDTDLNHRAGTIIAAKDGQLNVNVADHLNNQAGQLLATNAVKLSAASINNQQGQIASTQGGLTLITTGQLDTQSGRITGKRSLFLNTRGINNEKGLMQAETITITTNRQRMNNQSGRMMTDQRLLLQTGELFNNAGLIQSGGNLILNAAGQLDNSHSEADHRDNVLDAGIFSQGDMTIKTADISNQHGHIGSGGRLTIAGDSIANQQGEIQGGKETRVTTMQLNNDQGQLQSGERLTLTTQSLSNRGNGRDKGISSKQAMKISADAVDNEGGIIVSADKLNITSAQLNNSQGNLNAHKSLTLDSHALDNRSGQVQAQQTLWINTQGQQLDNTDGVLNSQEKLTVSSGKLINAQGTLHGKSGVLLSTPLLDNGNGGKLLSEQDMDINTQVLFNTGGQLLASNHVTVKVKNLLNNTFGLLRSGGDARLTMKRLLNDDTRQTDKGIEARNIYVTGERLDNRQGQLMALNDVNLQLSDILDNSKGYLQANQELNAQGNNLAFTNSQGDVRTGKNLSVSVKTITGNGKLRSLGDITLTTQQDLSHDSEMIANGRLQLDIGGGLTNRGLISANTLQGRVADLANDNQGKILANDQQWQVDKFLINTGLIDGANTTLKATTLINRGYGRIYGDHIALEAATLNNHIEALSRVDEWKELRKKQIAWEKQQKTAGRSLTPLYKQIVSRGQSGVIAARNRLDIGVGTLNNNTHSRIYSNGELFIGGSLNDQQQATGKGTVLNNYSSSIESAGNMQLAMQTINNENDNQETQEVLISKTPKLIYQRNGTLFDTKDNHIKTKHNGVELLMINGAGGNDDWDTFQKYDVIRTTEETQVISTDPAKILAGKNLTLITDQGENSTSGHVNNKHSQLVAGGVLTVTGGDLINAETPGKKRVTDIGQAESFWRIRRDGKDEQGWQKQPHNQTDEQAIQLKTSTAEEQQQQISFTGKSPEAYQGQTTDFMAVNHRQIESAFDSPAKSVKAIEQRTAQQLEVVGQQTV
ncbi:MAG: filamentous hemagglutinin N-terminal domain-containing protein, partial [Enterobacteriaceae bacterium]|nr:filamentous hemagglutinin N-terminal domain-containing protein [Enterobacteriaceae bacterium]